QPVVPHRTVRVADNTFGVATTVELAERAITDRVVELAYDAPIGRQLEFEVVAEQPQTHLCMRLVGLFGVVPAILDSARELHLIEAVAHTDSACLAICVGAGLRIAQLAELRAAAKIPPLIRREIDSGGMCEAGLRRTILITLLRVDAGAIRKPRLGARDKTSLATPEQLAVVRSLVFE